MSRLLREDKDTFLAAIEEAQDAVDYPPAIILKDYWVCEVLRALSQGFPGTFLFKGGTSLAKGWNLIDRMSEDVDILVSDRVKESVRARERRLLQMTNAIADVLGLSWNEHRAPGRGRDSHRDDLFEYPSLGFVSGGIETAGVLLQTGYGQGWEPHCVIDVKPLLADAMDSDAYDDLGTFEVPALLPVRTLIEKLHALHSAVSDFDDGGDPFDTSRLGRHFYDIYRCLGHQDTLRKLEDRERIDLVFRDVERISAARYGSSATRPEGGYGASPAFQPGFGNPRRDLLEKAYDEAEGLMRTSGRWPSLGTVLGRIQRHSPLL